MKTFFAVGAVVAAFCCMLVALNHNGAPRIGLLAALACGALTIVILQTAHDLQAPADLEEPRRSAPFEPLELAANDVPVARKTALRTAFLAMASVTGLLTLAPLVKLARGIPRSPMLWQRGVRLVTLDGKPVMAADIPIGSIETVFPQGHAGFPESATVLLRIAEDKIVPESGRENWAPGGALAYSKICTHAGCPVAIYRKEAGELYCPCHQSVFDIRAGAQPRSGPATRALPQLPLRVDEAGYFVADGPMSGPVGPDEWSRPI